MFYPKVLFINSMTFGGWEICRLLYMNLFQKEGFFWSYVKRLQSHRGFDKVAAEVSVNLIVLIKFHLPCANKSGCCIKCHKLYNTMTEQN